MSLNQSVMNSYENSVSGNDTMQIISFSIGSDDYALGIEKVLEVIRIEEIQKLPKAPDFLKGIINLRGEVIPVVDLRQRLEEKQIEEKKLKRTIVVKVEDKKVGMIVDKVSKVIRISQKDVKQSVNFSTMIDNNYVQGVVTLDGKMIIIIDIEKVFSQQEIKQFDELSQNIEEF